MENLANHEHKHGVQQLRSGWLETIEPLVPEAKKEAANYFFEKTIEAYSESSRHYHGVNHIIQSLKLLESHKNRADYANLFLALLWHDLIYDVPGPLNEERSAEAAVAMMSYLELDGGADVSRLINSTKHHKPTREDEQLVCAIDEYILASPWPQYLNYADGIRYEYTTEGHGPYSPQEFAAGRAEALNDLASGEGPFHHPDFVHLNPKAQQNMRRERNLLLNISGARL